MPSAARPVPTSLHWLPSTAPIPPARSRPPTFPPPPRGYVAHPILLYLPFPRRRLLLPNTRSIRLDRPLLRDPHTTRVSFCWLCAASVSEQGRKDLQHQPRMRLCTMASLVSVFFSVEFPRAVLTPRGVFFSSPLWPRPRRWSSSRRACTRASRRRPCRRPSAPRPTC